MNLNICGKIPNDIASHNVFGDEQQFYQKPEPKERLGRLVISIHRE